jgi:uncharacterized protein YecE (DUF72 family)
MLKISLGCAGWDYNDWSGSFYPKPLERYNRLEFYSKIFDIVVVNSTFYNLPNRTTVNKWYNQVPENFRFLVKVWQKITHNLNETDLDFLISQFFTQLSPLKDKVFAYLLQFPPWFKYSEKHFRRLVYLSKELPSEYRYVLELRDNSWFKVKKVLEIIDGTSFILGTTYMPGIEPHFLQNQNYYYIRLIGDRELNEFDRIQRNQKGSLSNLMDNLKILDKKPNIYEIFIIVNNHFQGNAPESVNSLKKILNLPLKEFTQQKKLSDYF